MNDRLKPWFFFTILFSVIAAHIAVVSLLKTPYDLSYGIASFTMFPQLVIPLLLSLWSSCGFIGTVLEIKNYRNDILPKTLSIIPVILVILFFLMNDYGESGFLAGIGLALWITSFGGVTVFFIIFIIILKSYRKHTESDFYEKTEPEKCFYNHKILYKTIFTFFSAVPVIIFLGTVGYSAVSAANTKIQNTTDKNNASEYLQNADEVITYQNSGDYYGDSILSTGLKESTILINYDEKRVSFVYRGYYDEGNLKTFILQPCTDIPKDELQYICKLNSPGKELKTYSDPSVFRYNSTCVTVEMQDGSLWYADMGGEFYNFEYAANAKIVKALEKADEVLEYGKNLPEEGDEFPPYTIGVTHNTFCLDHSDMTGNIIYCNGGNTWQDIGYSTSYGDIHVIDLKFEPFDGNLYELVPQAVIPLSSPDEYIIPYHINYGEQWGRCAGIILHTADGLFNADQAWYADFDKCEYSMTNEEAMHYLFDEYFNFDPTNGLRIYAKKTGDNVGDWRFALTENTKSITSDEESKLKFIKKEALYTITQHYPPNTAWYLTVLDDGVYDDQSGYETRSAAEELSDILVDINIQR